MTALSGTVAASSLVVVLLSKSICAFPTIDKKNIETFARGAEHLALNNSNAEGNEWVNLLQNSTNKIEVTKATPVNRHDAYTHPITDYEKNTSRIVPDLEPPVGVSSNDLEKKNSEPGINGLVKQPEMHLGEIPPIRESFPHQESILLPLINDGMQALSVLPVNEAYWGGQYLNPVAVPPEKTFPLVLIKTVEPIERRTTENKEQVQFHFIEHYSPKIGFVTKKPNVIDENMSPDEIQGEDEEKQNPTSSSPMDYHYEENKIDGQQPDTVYTDDVTREVEGGQKAVGSLRQEEVLSIDNKKNPKKVLEVTSPAVSPDANYKSVDFSKGQILSIVESATDDAEEKPKKLYSVQEISEEFADKVCFIVSKQ